LRLKNNYKVDGMNPKIYVVMVIILLIFGLFLVEIISSGDDIPKLNSLENTFDGVAVDFNNAITTMVTVNE
jgi:hypothetical protein